MPSLLTKGLADPSHGLTVLRQLFRGWRYKVWFRLRGLRFETGRNFRVTGTISLRGPGRVVIGDNVHIDGAVTPWTYSADAVISIGSNSYVNGTRFGCQREITIGPRAILGHAHIMDTNFHSTRADRRDNPMAPVRVAPVRLAENVWVAGRVGILAGTSIGANSVVGFGAVCSGDFPDNVIIAGNPARVMRPIADSDREAPDTSHT